jgi:diaminopimelate decarboxylase
MSPPPAVAARTWWTRPGLEVKEGRLHIAGRDAEAIARMRGTPIYVYDLLRVREQAEALRDALTGAGLRGVVRLALKAQREPRLLAFLRETCPWLGIDASSPGEVEWALRNGWSPSEISYTGTNLSERDLDAILGVDVHLNVDLLTQLDRLGRRSPGSSVGLRVNPRIGASFEGGEATLYAGPRPTKFGIFAEQLDEALAIADRHGLTIDTVHVHVGDGYLTPQLPVFASSMQRVAAMTRTLLDAGCPIAEVNTGGGLGVPQRAGDHPLDLAAWAAILSESFGPLGVAVATEPGDFLVKECAAALAEVVTLEERDGVLFAGLDAGWSQVPERFLYEVLLDPVLCRAADADPVGPVTVSGTINEGDDLFAVDHPLPALVEGDILALINVGSYNAAMASDHCLRPPAYAVFLEDRA